MISAADAAIELADGWQRVTRTAVAWKFRDRRAAVATQARTTIIRFPTWRTKDDAHPDSYGDATLVDVIVRKTSRLRELARIDDFLSGEQLLPTIAGVAAAGAAQPLRVLDFGGAAGSHFLVAKAAFPSRTMRWAVIETPAMAAAAAAKFGNDELRFFTDIAAAVGWLEGADLMHCDSALQYAPEPEAALDALIGLGAPAMLWARLMLADRRERFIQTSRLKDNGPGPLPEGVADRAVSYPATRLPRAEFLAAHERAGYRLAWKARETHAFLFLR